MVSFESVEDQDDGQGKGGKKECDVVEDTANNTGLRTQDLVEFEEVCEVVNGDTHVVEN